MTEKDALWQVGVKFQNEDQRKTEDTLVDQERTNGKHMKKKEGGSFYPISITTRSCLYWAAGTDRGCYRSQKQ